MHEPRPYGLFSKGDEPTERDCAFVDNLIRRCTNLKAVNKMPSMSVRRNLPDGGVVLVDDSYGTLRAITFKNVNQESEPEAPAKSKKKHSIPMLFSGVVLDPLPDLKGQGVYIRVTETTRRRLAQYNPNALPPKELDLARFRVPFRPAKFPEMNMANPVPGKLVTQYVKHRPSLYSGGMAEVMQIVAGYGIQNIEPQEAINQFDFARMSIPDDVYEQILIELGEAVLPGYTGNPPEDGAFRFNYKWHETDIVGIGKDGTAWLVRISEEGCLAMPLPLIPETTTRAFRDYVVSKNDDEILSILDRFGGMPSGEGFPRFKRLEYWKLAGVVMNIGDINYFYNFGQKFFDACGWSSNLNGTSIVNTHYSDYTAHLDGYTARLFELIVDYGDIKDKGLVKPLKISEADFPEEYKWYFESVNKYLGLLTTKKNIYYEYMDIIKYKIRKSTLQDLIEASWYFFRFNDESSDFEEEHLKWLEKPMENIADISINYSILDEGNFFTNNNFLGVPMKERLNRMIKLYTPNIAEEKFDQFVFPSKFHYAFPEAKAKEYECTLLAFYNKNRMTRLMFCPDYSNGEAEKIGKKRDVSIEDAEGMWLYKEKSRNISRGNFYLSDFDLRKFYRNIDVENERRLYVGVYESIRGGYEGSFAWENWEYSKADVYGVKYFFYHERAPDMDLRVLIPLFSRNTCSLFRSVPEGGYINSRDHWKPEGIAFRRTYIFDTNFVDWTSIIKDEVYNTESKYGRHDAFSYIGHDITNIVKYGGAGSSKSFNEKMANIARPNPENLAAPIGGETSYSFNPNVNSDLFVDFNGQYKLIHHVNREYIDDFHVKNVYEMKKMTYSANCFGRASFVNYSENRKDGLTESVGSSEVVNSNGSHYFIGVVNS